MRRDQGQICLVAAIAKNDEDEGTQPMDLLAMTTARLRSMLEEYNKACFSKHFGQTKGVSVTLFSHLDSVEAILRGLDIRPMQVEQ